MVATYKVSGPEPQPESGGVLREFFIAADEVEWDYAPLNGSACSLDGSVQPFEEGSMASGSLGTPEGTRIGSRWVWGRFCLI
jgi:hypothetical protein